MSDGNNPVVAVVSDHLSLLCCYAFLWETNMEGASAFPMLDVCVSLLSQRAAVGFAILAAGEADHNPVYSYGVKNKYGPRAVELFGMLVII